MLVIVMDQSRSSMRDLFKRLNVRRIEMAISTFSKASKNRAVEVLKAARTRRGIRRKKRNKTDAPKAGSVNNQEYQWNRDSNILLIDKAMTVEDWL
jgi:hypothetical protein